MVGTKDYDGIKNDSWIFGLVVMVTFMKMGKKLPSALRISDNTVLLSFILISSSIPSFRIIVSHEVAPVKILQCHFNRWHHWRLALGFPCSSITP